MKRVSRHAAAASSARLLTTYSGMGSSGVIFTFQPTFTQGLILGQCSILALLVVILKYLFLDTDRSQNVPVYADPAAPVLQPSILSTHVGEKPTRVDSESTAWLNTLLNQVCICLSPYASTRMLKNCVLSSPVCIAQSCGMTYRGSKATKSYASVLKISLIE